jgi:hypothetical protein
LYMIGSLNYLLASYAVVNDAIACEKLLFWAKDMPCSK